MKKLLPFLFVAALAGIAGWFGRAHLASDASHPASGHGDTASARRVLYYQSPMHPWIKSGQPGKCTVCGMDLVPVYEGSESLDSNLVTLSSNAVTVVGVQTASVRRRPLTHELHVAGTIDDDDSRHGLLSAYVDGRIDALFVNYEGAEVVAGQKLASIYSPMLLTSVREYVALRGQPGANATLLMGAATRLRQLGLAEAQIAALPETFHPTDMVVDILAPMTGTVVKRIAYAGQYVKEGETLFELGDFATMWFKFDAYERDLAWLHAGQNVEITTPSLPGQVFTNTLTFIDPNLDPATRSAKVRVEIPNPFIVEDGRTNRLLRHRLFADARVRSVVPEVLAVPRTAVLNAGGSPLVYVERAAGNYEPRPVRLGRIGDEVVEITDGLTEGERVVTHGNLLLDAQSQIAGQGRSEPPATSGQPVSPASRAAEPAANTAPLGTESRRAINDFLQAADAVREALAGDDLARFNETAMKLHPAIAALPKEGTMPALAQAASAAHLPEAKDLPSARKAFYPLITALVEVVRASHADPAFVGVKLYQCPMVKQAFPGAPKTAAWFQLGGPIHNPWFGPAMLDCGTELKP